MRWQAPGVLTGFGLEAELTDAQGAGNLVGRFGATYKWSPRFMPGSWFQFRVLPYQTRGRSTQLSLIHHIQLGPHFSLGGFTDVNIPWNGTRAMVVTESQLMWHAADFLGVAVEFGTTDSKRITPTPEESVWPWVSSFRSRSEVHAAE